MVMPMPEKLVLIGTSSATLPAEWALMIPLISLMKQRSLTNTHACHHWPAMQGAILISLGSLVSPVRLMTA